LLAALKLFRCRINWLQCASHCRGIIKGGNTGNRRPPFYPAPVSQNEGNKCKLTASYENLVRSVFISQLRRVTFAWFL
jgi:hypothetical protein